MTSPRVWLSLYVLIGAAFLGVTTPSLAQRGKPHQIVFELTSETPEHWEALLNNIENVQKALGKESTEVEVVAHGKGLALLKNTSTAKNRLATIAKTGVRFVACENTMRRQHVKKEDLVPEAGTVDSGVAEVVRKQEAGWSYVRSGS